MRTQIRRGCFETNSSSTHSLQIMQTDSDGANNYVMERIAKKYKKEIEKDNWYFDPDDFWLHESSGDTLVLKGIPFEDGDENKCVYAIISSWMAKVQYLAMLIHAYRSDIPEISDFWNMISRKYADEKKKNERYWESDQWRKDTDKCPDLQDTEIFKTFINLLKKTVKNKFGKDVNVNFIITSDYCHIDDDDSHYVSIDDDESGFFNKDALKDTKEFGKMIWDIMNNDEMKLFYIDEAYSPYEGPDIKIY